MMRRWLRPGELPQLGGWDLWRLREVGAWGDVARILGVRWEEVGGAALVERFGGRVVPLWRDKALGRWLGTLRLPNPDAVLVEADGGATTLRPVDLKWGIDTAEHNQIAGETLRQLVERAGERLHGLLPGDPAAFAYADGLFATPERALNRLYLRSRANLGDERPIRGDDVLAVPVDAPAFYAPLPGWPTARRLAGLDGVVDPAADLELADRYYHLGVGVRGALAAQRRSVFDERPDASDEALMRLDPAVEADLAARLERLIDECGGELRLIVRRVGRAQSGRSALRQQVRQLERLPYRYGEFMRDAAKAGMRPAEGDAAAMGVLRDIQREVAHAHAAAVRARGRELLAEGLDAPAVIERIQGEEREMARRARDRARALLNEKGRGT